MSKLLMPRLLCYWATLFLLCCSFFSCEEKIEKEDFVLTAPVNLNSFKINGVAGVINQATGTITVTLPYKSNIAAVTPELDLPAGATLSPAPAGPVNFGQEVTFTVVNGNLYKKYKVRVVVLDPVLKFSVNGVNGTIDHATKAISVVLPSGTNVTALTPTIELSTGVTISPASGTPMDFSSPKVYTIATSNGTEAYTVTVTLQTVGLKVGFLSVAPNRGAVSNPDEKAAADWLFNKYSDAAYIAFSELAGGRDISDFDVIWWHHDAAQDLPAVANEARAINALKNFRAGGGGLLLTTFAARYLEPLGIIPQGKGPNNVFGDFPPAGFVDRDNNWGISFKGHENHPLFARLQTYEPGKAYLLEKGTFRLNHTAWWFLPEWGGYGNGAGWRQQTGGINLASEGWDNELNGRVGIAEFPGNGSSDGKVVVITFGAYDWFNEPDAGGNASQPNAFKNNMERLTENSIGYINK